MLGARGPRRGGRASGRDSGTSLDRATHAPARLPSRDPPAPPPARRAGCRSSEPLLSSARQTPHAHEPGARVLVDMEWIAAVDDPLAVVPPQQVSNPVPHLLFFPGWAVTGVPRRRSAGPAR